MPPRKKTVASGAAKKTSPKASPKESPKDKQDSVAAAKLRALEYAKKAFKKSPSPTAAKTNAARASTPTSRRSTGGGTAKGKKRTVDEVEPDEEEEETPASTRSRRSRGSPIPAAKRPTRRRPSTPELSEESDNEEEDAPLSAIEEQLAAFETKITASNNKRRISVGNNSKAKPAPFSSSSKIPNPPPFIDTTNTGEGRRQQHASRIPIKSPVSHRSPTPKLSVAEEKAHALKYRKSLSPSADIPNDILDLSSSDEAKSKSELPSVFTRIQMGMDETLRSPKLLEQYIQILIYVFGALTALFVYWQISSLIGYGACNFLIVLTLLVGFMIYVYIKYHEYYHKTNDGSITPSLTSRWMNAAQDVVSDMADSVKMKIMELLMAIAMFVSIVFVCSGALWLMGIGSPSTSYRTGPSILTSVYAYFSLSFNVAMFIFVLWGAYYMYTWNTKRVASSETEVMSYALKAKDFLISLRVADNDGVAMSMFIEEFLDNLKLKDPAKRKKIKNMWKEIEEAMLDDKRIIKTGRISLPNGNTDNKYKYTKLASHSSKLYGGNTSNQPTFAFKSNTTANDHGPSSPYAPRNASGFFSSNTAYSSTNVPGARTLHKPSDPIVAQTGMKGGKAAVPPPKKNSLFSAFW